MKPAGNLGLLAVHGFARGSLSRVNGPELKQVQRIGQFQTRGLLVRDGVQKVMLVGHVRTPQQTPTPLAIIYSANSYHWCEVVHPLPHILQS
jgi:hypothetical protein